MSGNFALYIARFLLRFIGLLTPLFGTTHLAHAGHDVVGVQSRAWVFGSVTRMHSKHARKVLGATAPCLSRSQRLVVDPSIRLQVEMIRFWCLRALPMLAFAVHSSNAN